MRTHRETLIVNLLKSIESKDVEGFSAISQSQYRQHNLHVADGRQGFLDFVFSMPDGMPKVSTRRVFEDGEYVVAHSELAADQTLAVFDIFKFDGERIVEHWDAAQPMLDPNPSGRTLLDGQEDIGDAGVSLADSKGVARAFVENVLMSGNLSVAEEYVGPEYLQHHPLVRDGLDGLREAFADWMSSGVEVCYENIHFVLGKGDFVLVVTEGRFNGAPVAFYDMFRISKGKIVEHWDVVEEVPPKEQWQNDNGKF